MSPIPVEPEPTPRKTKPPANTTASSTYITFACRRSREKKSCSSQLGAAFFRFAGCCGGLRRAPCAAPLAMAGLGYLPVVGVAELAQAGLRRLVAERAGQARLE